MSATAPAIAIDGSASSGGGSSSGNATWSIGQDYASLIAAGSTAFQASGARIFEMDAGALSMASTAQIGRTLDGVTITAAMVAENQAFLDAIAAYCRENGISVHVEAQLTNAPAADWTYQWLAPSIRAGLPITAVVNDDEVEPTLVGTAVSLDQRAANEVRIVSQIVNAYPDVAIGQYETEAPLSETQTWWSTYGAAAAAAGLPGISFIIADTPWNAPWLLSQAEWQAWQLGISNLAATNGMELEVLLDGISADTTGYQWTAQSEQHAAMLGQLAGMNIATLLVRTWCQGYPAAVLPVNQPTTTANAAAEIAAIFPLYQAGRIDGTGTLSVGAPPQLVVASGTTSPIGGLSLSWSSADPNAGERYAVVVMSGTGLLYAQTAGGGTVTGSGTTKLVMNGTKTDLAAELLTLAVQEPVDGPDAIDIEAFGTNGRLSDTQFAVFASGNASATGRTTTIGSPAQGWTAASTSTNPAGIVTDVALTWNPAAFDPVTGQAMIARTVSIHEPIAESGVGIVGGVAVAAAANPAKGTAASLPVGASTLIVLASDVSNLLSQLNVLQSDFVYSGTSGRLQTQTDSLAPANPVAALQNPTFGNYLATGGKQVTQYNTGDNPNWSPDWNPGLGSVTTTYGSGGQILEQVFQGGASNPYFTLDNVFDPYTGALWEQIQSGPPPSGYGSFVTGTKYVTQFNTGDNPNWNYVDWGTAPRMTVLWQDWKVVGVTATPAVPVGPVATLAYGSPVVPETSAGEVLYAGTGARINAPGSGLVLDLFGNGATAAIGDNATVSFDGTGATVRTGIAASVNFWGAGNTLVAGAGSKVWLTSGQNTVTVGTDSMIDQVGVGNLGTIGDRSVAFQYGSGGFVTAGDHCIVDQFRSNNAAACGDNASIWMAADNGRVTAGAHAEVTMLGTGNAAAIGSDGKAWLIGNGNAVQVGTGGMVFISGLAETVTIGPGGGTQTIAGFSVAGHDVLDLSQLLAGEAIRPDLSNLGDYVSVAVRGVDAVLTVAGNAGDVVTLSGAGAVSLQDMIANHALTALPA